MQEYARLSLYSGFQAHFFNGIKHLQIVMDKTVERGYERPIDQTDDKGTKKGA